MKQDTNTEGLLKIAKSVTLFGEDLDAALKMITEGAAVALDVERVSVWFYDATRTSIRCADLFEKSKHRHSSGTTLSAQDYPRYFAALEEERTIAADDACRDPRTSEFTEGYLIPLRIVALLDAPIRVGGEMVGVVCHEHVGEARLWTAREASFAGSMADFAALSRETRDRVRAQKALRREIEARVSRERLAALGEMSAVVAHEIRNPIGAVCNSVSCLRHAVDRTPEVETLLAVIEEEAARLVTLADDLLTVARPAEAGCKDLLLGPVVEGAVEVVRRQPRYAERNVRFDVDYGPSDVRVFSDPNLLHRATLNLLTNAVEASGQGAWVRVTVRPAVDGLVHLDVKNEAESTSDENVALVFEPFFTTKPVGSGLGLAIVKQLMTTLRGTVDFQQQGGVVTVSLGIPATSAEHDRLAGAAARG